MFQNWSDIKRPASRVQASGLMLMLLTGSVAADVCSDLRATWKHRSTIAAAMNAYVDEGGSTEDAVYEALRDRSDGAYFAYRDARENLLTSINNLDARIFEKKYESVLATLTDAKLQSYNLLGRYRGLENQSFRDSLIVLKILAETIQYKVLLAIGCQKEVQ